MKSFLKYSLKKQNNNYSKLYQFNKNFFSSIQEIKSVPNHKAPTKEDTVSGRYSETLFTAASRKENLYNVYNDMAYLLDLYKQDESFRTLADNSGLNAKQLYSYSEELAKLGDFCDTSLQFLDLLGKNKRFMYVNQIAEKYLKAYTLLTKEEKITIYSAKELLDNDKDRVRNALESNPENKGKSFIIEYVVNPSILGGLQMYTENRFMDLSLNSRVEKLKEEVNRYI